MKIAGVFILLLFPSVFFGQLKKVELFDLVKKLVQDSTIYSSAGDWAVGSPAAYPVKWETDRVIMSDDININFYRKGVADISINGASYSNPGKPLKWNVMLKGPRMGFTSFSIESDPSKDIRGKISIDSLFGKKPYTYKLLKDCSSSSSAGFYYYQVSIPKKVSSWMKIAWSCSSGNCMISVDCYDDWSKQYAALTCPVK